MMCKKTVFVVILSILICGCADWHRYDEMNGVAMRFFSDYFNFRYEEALEECTSESEKWLRFAASNISSEDIEAINKRTRQATCIVKESYYGAKGGIDSGKNGATRSAQDARSADDTTGVVTLLAYDCLVADSFGAAMKYVPLGTVSLNMRKRNGTWQVALAALPRVLWAK